MCKRGSVDAGVAPPPTEKKLAAHQKEAYCRIRSHAQNVCSLAQSQTVLERYGPSSLQTDSKLRCVDIHMVLWFSGQP